MAGRRITARKSTRPRPREIGRTDHFYSYRMGPHQEIIRFLNQFFERWRSVKRFGVSELDGVLQLVTALPPAWRGWASEAALDFISPDMEVRITGNLVGFMSLIREQFQTSRIPPASQFFSPTQFIVAVHQILDDRLNPHDVDTSNLQPLNTREMPPDAGNVGGTSESLANPTNDPSVASEESDPETPEGYRD